MYWLIIFFFDNINKDSIICLFEEKNSKQTTSKYGEIKVIPVEMLLFQEQSWILSHMTIETTNS